ncbi:MAG TPA: signal recognition particle-docking protein FtsY [Campylobacterales bacterium]|nr:signal recognition particle-docking protein FtsY [Campylobacterales bacterium]
MFGLLKKSLQKTVAAITEIIGSKKETITKEELEEILVTSDIDYEVVEGMLENLPKSINKIALQNALSSVFFSVNVKQTAPIYSQKPFVDLIIGVNGAGKTTTIAKLANMAKKDGKTVILGAGDTFRAAAVEQLDIWAKRLGVLAVTSKIGADPSSVAYDTINSALSKGADYAVIDTAGRLHTQTNLAEELKKIVRVCEKAMPGAPHRKIAIIDATAGSSAINQAKAFDAMIGLDAVIVTKLDGTAKGGAIFSIVRELGLPILYVGVGEKPDDIEVFDTKTFVDEFVGAIFKE